MWSRDLGCLLLLLAAWGTHGFGSFAVHRHATAMHHRHDPPCMGEWVRLGKCSTPVKVPAPDAFAILEDYQRWPEWSPWLKKVVIDENDALLSRWFLNARGIQVSWMSKTTEVKPGALIQWESVSGVRNGGCLTLDPTSSGCVVTIEMSFIVPRAVRRIFSASIVEEFVSRRLQGDLQRFAAVAERERDAA
jgi:uncharacterized membrane protein